VSQSGGFVADLRPYPLRSARAHSQSPNGHYPMTHFIKIFILTGLVFWPIVLAVRYWGWPFTRDVTVVTVYVLLMLAGVVVFIVYCVRVVIWIVKRQRQS
jgi:hypothetical protein